MHLRETHLTSNTARLSTLILKNSELRLRGLQHKQLDLSDVLTEEYTPLLLYPSDDAIELTKEYVETLKKPVLLIVPDGSWRQASKVGTREPQLKKVTRVKLVHSEPSEYQLRKQKGELGLSTIEAIARALGILESPSIQKEIERVFRIKVERTLISRGEK